MWYYEGRIRIEPDWNVKMVIFWLLMYTLKIRIEPDWNVKGLLLAQGWSHDKIRIEPDWNVKVRCYHKSLLFAPY